MIDEWLLERPDELFGGMLLELFELRYGRASTVLCTRYRKKDWQPRLAGGVHADAIMDRIVHNAVWLEMGDMYMRQAMAGKGREPGMGAPSVPSSAMSEVLFRNIQRCSSG